MLGLDDKLKAREVELGSIYPGSMKNRRLHILIEDYLRENKKTALQSELSDEFFEGDKMRCSRFMRRMEIEGYNLRSARDSL